jgi:CBS domain-containing protein
MRPAREDAMIRLRDIMTTDVVSVSPDLTIRDAMELLSSRHLSGVPVVAAGKVVGVVTATDLMEFAADLPGAPTERPEQQEEGEWAAAEEEGEGGEVEVEGTEPSATYFTELWTDVGADTDVRFANTSGPEWNALDEHTVAEAMTRAPIRCLTPDTPVPAAAEFIGMHNVHRVLVMDGERLVGIATASDISKAVADHRLTSRTYVFGNDSRFDKRGWQRRE